MKYIKSIKLFESKKYSRSLYYLKDIEDLMSKEWINLIIDKNNTISFEIEDNDYRYEVYYKDNNLLIQKPEIFMEKFKKSFLKNPRLYIDDIKRDLNFLGNLDIYRKAKDFNL